MEGTGIVALLGEGLTLGED